MLGYIQVTITVLILAVAIFMIPNAIDKQYQNNDMLKLEYKYK